MSINIKPDKDKDILLSNAINTALEAITALNLNDNCDMQDIIERVSFYNTVQMSLCEDFNYCDTDIVFKVVGSLDVYENFSNILSFIRHFLFKNDLKVKNFILKFDSTDSDSLRKSLKLTKNNLQCINNISKIIKAGIRRISEKEKVKYPNEEDLYVLTIRKCK